MTSSPKLVAAIATLLAVGAACKTEHAPAPTAGSAASSAGPAAPGSASGSAATIDTCQIGVAALEHGTCASPEGTKFLDQARRTLAGTIDVARKATAADPHQLEIVCARLVQAFLHDTAKNGCKVELAEADRKQIAATLEAWYAERTPVTGTGSGASDAVIARIVAVRDAMCACGDLACITRVDAQLDTIGALPTDAPQAAHDLGGKLLDDVSRCEARIRDPKP